MLSATLERRVRRGAAHAARGSWQSLQARPADRLFAALAGAVALVIDLGEGAVELGQPGPRLCRQRNDLCPLVSRRPLGVVLVVGWLEVGSIDHLVERALQRGQPSLCSRPLGRQQLSQPPTFGLGQRRDRHPCCLHEASRDGPTARRSRGRRTDEHCRQRSSDTTKADEHDRAEQVTPRVHPRDNLIDVPRTQGDRHHDPQYRVPRAVETRQRRHDARIQPPRDEAFVKSQMTC